MAEGRKRSRRREQRWRRLMREHGESGLTVREFCRRRKVTETAFYYWRRELQRREAELANGSPTDAPASFVAVRLAASDVEGLAASDVEGLARGDVEGLPERNADAVEGDRRAACGRIEIGLPGGCRVAIVPPVDRQALGDVLAALRSQAFFVAGPTGGCGEGQGMSSAASAKEGGPC